ncbi:MAG: type I restriction enzyme HsdR N-terminal domain-containing protein [Verrucomicrobia bacterium]|nr:type I restriction enzyme HsdR N-terminal domain-containing protein [Verrucomicrobiota bacterium]
MPALIPVPNAVIVAQGKLLDYIDGVTQREETPEEYVRQEIAKSLVREYGYAKRDIAVEFSLKVGSKKPRADLVVFPEGEEAAQENAFIIVECKSDKIRSSDKKDGVEQLKSYLAVCPNATYGMWTNGIERHCFRRVERGGRVEFEDDIPDIPSCGETPDDAERPTVDQLKPASSDALLFCFRRCHDYIHVATGKKKPDAFWDLLQLIFCKIYDERNSNPLEFYAAANERHGINGPLKVKVRLDKLFAAVKAEFGNIFKANDTVDMEPRALAYLVSQLQMYSLLESEVDVKGHAYEAVVGSNLAGDRGEFFTPRNICQMAVTMLDPGEKQLVMDPSCGTGGFLITAMNHVINRIFAEEHERGGSDKRKDEAARSRIARYASRYIVGIDINPDLVKASKMNMVMNNDGAGGLYRANSLEHPQRWEDELRERNLFGKVDLIFTNPPFGAKLPIDDPSILEQYDLGHVWTYDADNDRWGMGSELHKSQPPERLFIERCVRLLKPGSGRMAIVLPDGILGSPGLGYVREWILRHCRILASIDLHGEAFEPRVHIQTSVLVLERKSGDLIAVEHAAEQMNDYPVFMALANHIGHDKRGNVTYVRDKHGNEIAEEVVERVVEIEDGKTVVREQKTRRKVVDDNTQQIALAFQKWLSELG